jgi:hypothetical protein
MVEILWHSHTKGRETENTNLNLNRRASSRPYLMGLEPSNGCAMMAWRLCINMPAGF